MGDITTACHYLGTVAEHSFSLSSPWQELRARSILAQVHQGDSSLVEPQCQRIRFLLEHIEQTISPMVMETITDWISNH